MGIDSKIVAEVSVPPASEQDFPIVGIGASAGGLDAFKRFLRAIPEQSGMAYVLVQHLDPSHESLLPEILAKVTRLPVNEITDDIHLAPDHIYVIPENKMLTSTDGVLKITPRSKIKTNLVIDVFFKSLAEVHQSLAVGVVLSGNASDGTIGLSEIRAHGGITFAQDQASAAHGDMPRNAVNANVVDFVMAPEKMPGKMLELIPSYTTNKDGTPDKEMNHEHLFNQIISILHKNSGADFTYYKQTTIRRRIMRRIAISKQPTLASYLNFLRGNKSEVEALFKDLLIQVTAFFRDPKIFQAVTEEVFPEMMKNKTSESPVRIWVAGCSTGEEAYTFAMLLHLYLGDSHNLKQVQIFASDISESSIARARSGIYSKGEIENIPESFRKKYLAVSNGNFQVIKEVRDMCVFAVHNFIKDPPFARMDLVSCRNVLIYMDNYLQKKALHTFHYSLNKTGFLLLGKSETSGPASELFLPYVKNSKIYTPTGTPDGFLSIAHENFAVPGKHKKITSLEPIQSDFRKSTESVLLSQYTPAGVVVNDQLEVVHIHGNISPFLEPPQGKPTFNLIRMANPNLAFDLRNGVFHAKTTGKTYSKEKIPLRSYDKLLEVGIEVRPLENTKESFFLVIFHSAAGTEIDLSSKNNFSVSEVENHEMLHRIDQLEKELAHCQHAMNAIVEDQQTSYDDLQGANEELLSGSEELQSLNEELETSKEELQSTNEELIIVNQELLDKQEEINAAIQYTEAIVATIREPLVVLDRELQIKSVNKSFLNKFNITNEEAAGKSFFEIKNSLFNNDELRSMLMQVYIKKTDLNNFEIIIHDEQAVGSTIQLNARLVQNEKQKEQLLLLAIDDITERKTVQLGMKAISEDLEEKVKERTTELQHTNKQLEQFAHTASHELQEPLRKILTFSSLLRNRFNQGKTTEVKEYLEKMENSARRMSALVKNILEFANVSHHGNLFEDINLNEIFNNILSDFELLIDEKKAMVISENLPVIEAVHFQMHQLFYDIIGNALKFSKDGVPPVIYVTAHEMTVEEIKLHPGLNHKLSYYEIVFKDNGIGFDQKYAQQIFTMFQRLDVSGNYPGTGIGLALCKKIVVNYNGEIYARGKQNKGSSFHVILPRFQKPVKRAI